MSTNEMLSADVERVARAICNAKYKGDAYNDSYLNEEEYSSFREQARAALAAMPSALQWRGIESAQTVSAFKYILASALDKDNFVEWYVCQLIGNLRDGSSKVMAAYDAANDFYAAISRQHLPLPPTEPKGA